MSILLKYKRHPMTFFGDGEWQIRVELFIEKKTWFGLFKKVVVQEETLMMFHDLKETFEYYDELIKNKTPL